MLKKIMGSIRRQLLKIYWIKLQVEAYQVVQKKKRHHERWAQLMHSGRAVRDLEPERLKPYETLATVSDEGLIVEYMNGRIVGQEYVNPVFLDSTNWGVGKNPKDLKSNSTNDVCGGTDGTEKRDGTSDDRTYAGLGPCSSDFG